VSHEQFDAVIVGGGPAGSTCARRLVQAGCKVLVWDRARFPRDKVCAGWITPQVMATLALEPDAYTAAGRTFQRITGFAVSRLGDAEARVRYDEPISFGIRRCEFDAYLLRRAGATLRLGELVRSLVRHNGTWTINDAVRTPILIGAGGHFCPVAQHLGAELGAGEPIIAAQEAEFVLPEEHARACSIDPEIPEIFFTRDLKGYAWAFRKGTYLNIGLGRQDRARVGEHVSAFRAFLERCRKIPPGLPLKMKGHPYLLYTQAPRPLIGDGALLIGDAAGLAYPKSGEGIRPAIESGLLAAETMLAAGAYYDRDRLAPYKTAIERRFGRRTGGWAMTNLLPDWLTAALAGRLFASPWFARHVVLDRWFFHADQAALAGHSPTAGSLS
jgi:geranylgeranyl reductase family protein